MSLLIPSESDALILNIILGKQTAPSTQTLRLFKNDYVPSKSSTLSGVTEATQEGYVPITLNSSNWLIDTLAGVTSANYPEQTFTFSELAVIYGYYVTVTINSIEYLLWIERFSNGPYELPSAGGSVSVSLNLGAS